MNVFVLCTGRCGSTTFVEACKHITNYSASHESRSSYACDGHFDYSEDHIEVDNRLAWFLGRLDTVYGDEAAYVHLRRNVVETARSFAERWDYGIIRAYREDILPDCKGTSIDVCTDYCRTVNSNIGAFLKDKTRTMHFEVESAKTDFQRFWALIGAQGDLAAALSEWDIPYNASSAVGQPDHNGDEVLVRARRLGRKLYRIGKAFPAFLKNA